MLTDYKSSKLACQKDVRDDKIIQNRTHPGPLHCLSRHQQAYNLTRGSFQNNQSKLVWIEFQIADLTPRQKRIKNARRLIGRSLISSISLV